MTIKHLAGVLIIGLAMLLSSCGGGGGDDDESLATGVWGSATWDDATWGS